MKNTKVVVRGPGAVLVTILRIPSLVFDMTNDLISFFVCLGTLDWSLSFGLSLLLSVIFQLRIAVGFCLAPTGATNSSVAFVRRASGSLGLHCYTVARVCNLAVADRERSLLVSGRRNRTPGYVASVACYVAPVAGSFCRGCWRAAAH